MMQCSEQAQDQTMSLHSIYKKLYKLTSDNSVTTKKEMKYVNPSSAALITRYISSSCAVVLIEIEKIATRIHERVLAATLHLFVSVISSVISTNSKTLFNGTEKLDETNTKRNARISHSPITTPLT